MGDDVRLVLQRLCQHLPQRSGVEALREVPVQEEEFAFWMHLLPPEHLLALMQNESTSGLALRHGGEGNQSCDV